MSDLTFLNSNQPAPVPGENKAKKNTLATVLVALVVVALLAEAAYFFYNRYVSNKSDLPFENLSNSGTMEEQSAPVDKEPVQNTVGFSQVGDASQQKAEETVDAMFKYPSGFITNAEILSSLEGKVVSVLRDDVMEIGGATYTTTIKLVNATGVNSGVRFTDFEVEKMRVVVINKGVEEREARLDEIVPGDFLNIRVKTDLMDARNGVDYYTIEIRNQ
jgi:flagellar basal body-associated protein FliL